MSTEPTTRLIRASVDLLDYFGSKTDDGRRLTAVWGEPDGHCPDSDEYIYTPTFTASGDTEADRIAQAVAAERKRIRERVNDEADIRLSDGALAIRRIHVLAIVDPEP